MKYKKLNDLIKAEKFPAALDFLKKEITCVEDLQEAMYLYNKLAFIADKDIEFGAVHKDFITALAKNIDKFTGQDAISFVQSLLKISQNKNIVDLNNSTIKNILDELINKINQDELNEYNFQNNDVKEVIVNICDLKKNSPQEVMYRIIEAFDEYNLKLNPTTKPLEIVLSNEIPNTPPKSPDHKSNIVHNVLAVRSAKKSPDIKHKFLDNKLNNKKVVDSSFDSNLLVFNKALKGVNIFIDAMKLIKKPSYDHASQLISDSVFLLEYTGNSYVHWGASAFFGDGLLSSASYYLMLNKKTSSFMGSVYKANLVGNTLYTMYYTFKNLNSLLYEEEKKEVKASETTFVLMGAQINNTDMVKRGLKLGEDINKFSKNELTALFNGISNNNIELVTLLIENGADIKKVSTIGPVSALAYAVMENNLEMVRLILKYKADVNREESNKDTALMYAVSKNNLEIVDLLIKNGADVNKTNALGNTVLHFWIQTNSPEMLKILLENKVDLNQGNLIGTTALIYAIQKNNFEAVDLLLENGADINHSGPYGTTVLMYAAQNNNLEAMEFLLKKGADINQVDSHGNTALMYAVQTNNIEAAEFLIEKGADVNQNSSSEYVTALDLAILLKYVEMTELLQAKGAQATLSSEVYNNMTAKDSAFIQKVTNYYKDKVFKNVSSFDKGDINMEMFKDNHLNDQCKLVTLVDLYDDVCIQ